MAETSGQTTPGDGIDTIFSDRKRNRSLETVISETTHENAQIETISQSTIALPDQPVNSPTALSTMGDYQEHNSIDTASLAQRLAAMRGNLVSPPASEPGDRGSTVPARSRNTTDQRFTDAQAGPSKTIDFAHKRRSSNLDSPYGKKGQDPTFEHSYWGDYAEEDVNRAFARLAMVARDEHKTDGGAKPLSDYYSVRLAKLIKNAEIEFDTKFLQ